MGAEIDSLEIKILSSTKQANSAIDDLITNLGRLANSLKIDTSGLEKIGKALNFSGMEKAAKNMQSQMKNIEKSIDKPLDKVQEKVEALQRKFSESGKGFQFKGNSEQLEKEAQKVSGQLEKLYGRKDRMIELGKVDTESFKGLIRDIENAKNKLDILENSRPDALNRTLEENARKAKESSKSLTEMKEKLKEISVPPIREDNFGKLQSTLRRVEEEIDRLRAKLANGLTLGTIKESAGDKGFQNLSAQIAYSEKRAEMLRQKIQDIGGVGSAKTASSVDSVSKTFYMLGSAAEKTADMIEKAFKGIASIVSTALSKAGKIVSSVAGNITSAFSNLIRNSARAASAVKNAASKISSSFLKIGKSSDGIKSASINLGNLLKTALGFKALQGLKNFSKSAIELGSDITEVENVVDVAFGSMAAHAYNFASRAKEQFGLSELAAKQYSGTMMAMLKSSGFDKNEGMMKQAAVMSTTLAGLAGDIASFYNIDTDTAFYKLRSAISGETEPMKQLGVNMNIVNLEAFAMSRGINKAYKEMTLAEQATLRYEYILAKTTDAHGDFARTSGTWANQLRLLKLNFESLSAVIGQGLIAAILPAIKWLNALMSKLMQAAKAFRSFMYTLMGQKLEGSQGGIVNDMAGSIDDMGDAAEEAGKKIKEKLLLLPFDELNILSETSEKLDDSVGDFDMDIDMGDFDDFEDIDTSPISKWAQAIRDAILAQDWEGLGKTLAELVNIGLQKVYDAIKAITPKVEQALKNFAKVFNSFVKWLDWDLLGRTIGAGINLITTSINALLGDDGINFEQLGEKLSEGFRGMIDEIDWQGLGNAIGNWFMVAWRIAYGFIEGMWKINPDTLLSGWEELGNGLGEAIAGIFERIDFVKIATVITEGFKGVLETLTYTLNTLADNLDWIVDKINAGLQRLYDGLKWDSTAGEVMAQKITDFTDAVSNAFNKLLDLDFGMVGKIIGAGITDIVRAFNQLTDISGGIDFEKLGRNLSDGLRNLVTEIPWGEFGNALGNGFMVAWRILDGFLTDMAKKSDAGLTGWQEIGVAIGDAINGMFEKVNFSDIARVITNLINGLFASLKEAVATIKWDEIADNISSGINTAIENMDWKENGSAANDFLSGFLGMLLETAQSVQWDELGRSIGDFLSQIDWAKHLRTVWETIKSVFSGLLEGMKESLPGQILITVTEMIGSIKLAEMVDNVLTPILTAIFGPKGTIAGKIISGLIAIFPIIANLASSAEAMEGFNHFAHGMLDKIGEAISSIDWGDIGRKIIDFIVGIDWLGLSGKTLAIGIEIIGSIEAGLIEAILTTDWIEVGKNLIEGFVNGVVSFFGALFDVAKKIVDAVVNSIKELFGIHSPSTVMAEIGTNVMQGLINGIKSLVDAVVGVFVGIKDNIVEVWNNVSTFLVETWDKLKNWASEKFTQIRENVSNAWNGVKEKATEIWENVTSYLGEKWESIRFSAEQKFTEIKEKVNGAWEGAKEKASEVWDVVTTYLSEKWESIRSNASEKFAEIKEKISSAWDGAKEKAHEVWNSVTTYLGEKWENIRSTAQEKFGEAKEKVVGSWQNIKEDTTAKWDEITTSLKGTWENITKDVSECWDGIHTFLSEKIPKIVGDTVDWFKELPGKIKDKAKETVDGFTSGFNEKEGDIQNVVTRTAGNVIDWFADKLEIHSPSRVFYGMAADTIKGYENGLDSEDGTVKAKMEGIASTATTPFEGLDQEFNRIGVGMVSELDVGVNSQISRMVDVMRAMIDSMMGAFNNMDYNAIGVRIMDGISNGINSNVHSVLNSIGSVASNMISRFTNVLGIHSPSRVFYGLAEYTMEGFINGVDSEERTLVKTLTDIASSIGTSFSESFNNSLNLAVQALSDYTYSITPELSNMSFKEGGFPDTFSMNERIMDYGNTNSVNYSGGEEFFNRIKQASYEGQMQAQNEMLGYLADIARNTRETADKDLQVNIGDREIHAANKRGAARAGFDFSNPSTAW